MGTEKLKILDSISNANVTNAKLETVISSTSGNIVNVNSDGQMHIVGEGHLCTSNSTETPLLAGATWIGTAKNLLPYNGMSLFVTSDVSSAAGGIEVQYSDDGINGWITAESYTLVAGAEKFFTPPTFGAYFRIKFTNGAADQTTFKISTKLSKFPFKWSSHNIEDAITDQDDATLTKAVITGKKADGNYDNVSLTNGGNMKVSLEEIETTISTNSNSQLNVSPYIVDEYGNYTHELGDNIFKGSAVSIPPEHHEIHCGDSYTSHHVADLSNGATIDYTIHVPDWGTVGSVDTGSNQSVKLAHFVGEVSGEAETSIYFYESPVVSATGTAMDVNNRNRNSSNVDYIDIYYGSTVGTLGTELEHSKFGSGLKVGGGVNRTDEWILKNNTTYLVRVVNETANNNYHTIRFQYYVHPGI